MKKTTQSQEREDTLTVKKTGSIITGNFCIALFSGVQTHCALQHSPTFSKLSKNKNKLKVIHS